MLLLLLLLLLLTATLLLLLRMVAPQRNLDSRTTDPLQLTPIMMLQINTVMLGELASPGVRHSRVQQNTSAHRCNSKK